MNENVNRTEKSESKEFEIGLSGFCDREQNALSSIFKLSAGRPRRYTRWEQGRGRPDVVVVNEDVLADAQEWAEIRRVSGMDCPVLRVGAASKASEIFDGTRNKFVKRPVLAIRILNALDDIVTDAYDFAPELSIRDTLDTDSIAHLAKTETRKADAEAKRVLVVDDSESARKMMGLHIAKKGYAVDFASSGEDALEKAGEQPYDLIFLDVMLPGIDGYEVSRQLKRHLRVEAHVVMLTGKTSRIDKLRGTLALADAYLTKPLSITALNESLQRYLG